MSASESSYAVRVFDEAVNQLLRPRTTAEDAEQAAAVVALVGTRFDLEERDLSDLVRIADLWLGNAAILRDTMNVLRARTSPEQANKLLLSIMRLAARASAERHTASVFVLVWTMTHKRTWCCHVKPAWVGQAIDFGVLDREKRAAVSQLLAALVRPAFALTLRELIEHRQDMFKAIDLPPWLAWRIQVTVPTVGGWRALAARPWRKDDVPAAETFGSELDTAIETLEAALGSEPEGARHVTLARWLGELRGTP